MIPALPSRLASQISSDRLRLSPSIFLEIYGRWHFGNYFRVQSRLTIYTGIMTIGGLS